jgi:Mrp family chromosome partitioning ATPase
VLALCALLTTGAAFALLETRERDYEATAEILITPLGIDDRAFLGVQVLRAGGDVGRTIQTAVGLIDSEAAASRTAQAMGSPWTTRRVRDHVDVDAAGGSALLGVKGRADTAAEAAELATTFARSALEERRARLAEQLDGATDEVTQQIEALPRDQEATGYADQLRLRRDTLVLAARTGDPTLSLAEAAPVPTGRPGQPLWLLLGAALLAGLGLGTVAAVALDGLDRRIRDEDEIDEIDPIPVLARVPMRRGRTRAFAHDEHRALTSEIAAAGAPSRTVLVTSASGGEGATSTAVALATALAEAGRSVILADFDLRSPGIADALGLEDVRRLGIARGETVNSGLNPVPGFDQLNVLVPETPTAVDRRGQAAMQRLLPEVLAQASALADHVIVDTAPLGRHADALWLSRAADRLLVVLRPGHTRRSDYCDLRDRLARTQTRPDGAVIVGSDGRI